MYEVSRHLARLSSVTAAVADDPLLKQFADKLSTALINSIRHGGRILFAGNGGSFADAMHTAAEFTGHLNRDRHPLPAVVLGANPSSLTAIGNDYGYGEIFSREFAALACRNSTLWIFSSSGESSNLIKLVQLSRSMDVATFALLGKSGGTCADLSENYVVRSSDTTTIQEVHMSIAHAVCEVVDDFVLGVIPDVTE